MSFIASFSASNHRRWNPLKEEWVLVSPQRTQRPWSGAVEKKAGEQRNAYEPDCYLCPGNRRASGATNPRYESTFSFDNDFAALSLENARAPGEELNGLIKVEPGGGICRVICFSPRHDLTIPQMTEGGVRQVIEIWADEYARLSANTDIRHVMTFENKGQIMGCSNPHPHGQIWATAFVPNTPLKEASSQNAYYASKGRLLLLDYLEWELSARERIVCQNSDWVALVPFWAVWPFEIMILPRRAVQRIADLSDGERSSWAAIFRELTIRYDNLFETSFPYSMGVYQRPVNSGEHPGFVLHQNFFPPLLRSASVKKFMVGFELTAEPQRDITAEQAAGRLRELATRHYAEKSN